MSIEFWLGFSSGSLCALIVISVAIFADWYFSRNFSKSTNGWVVTVKFPNGHSMIYGRYRFRNQAVKASNAIGGGSISYDGN